jgi:gamma-glutamyl-gamma-aminobutyraldehyde dehydrogenase
VTATLPDTIRTQAFIDGRFVDAANGATFDSVAPATGQVIAKIAACGDADVDAAVVGAPAAVERATGVEYTRPTARRPYSSSPT